MCIRHNIPNLINSTDQIIEENSRHTVSKVLLSKLKINLFKATNKVVLLDCYICRRENV